MKNKKSKPNRSSKIKVTFKGGRLSNYSGILPIHNFMKKLKVRKLFQEKLTISEHHNTQFSLEQKLTSIILGLLSGQDRIIKIESFTHDPLVQKLVQLKKNLDKDPIIEKIKRFTFRHTNELKETQREGALCPNSKTKNSTPDKATLLGFLTAQKRIP